jgi:diadenosine tetraphosphatase ApaH/serine/threonine PP2A family protein phosphatase
MIALLGDIHANLQAFEAVVEDARDKGATGFALLGDYVGYGGDPCAVLERVMDLAADGAPAVRGNHDDMAADFDREMNPTAAYAASWTRNELSHGQRDFLDSLPLTIAQGERLYVHADASEPARWRYVHSVEAAQTSLTAASGFRVVVCGHVHEAAMYAQTLDGRIARHRPQPGFPIPLLPSRRWHIVLPSVGQPRDGDTTAGYAMLDTAGQEVSFHRVPYDIEGAAAAIRKAGLPEGLAARLFKGR